MAIVPTPPQSASSNSTARRAVSTSGEPWRQSMKLAFRRWDDLRQVLSLPEEIADLVAASKEFPLFVPREFAAKMQPGDPADPLLLQVLPTADEREDVPGYVTDPVGDAAATHGAGLLRKYHGRALLITTGACAVHCRYCFRRHFPYETAPKHITAWLPALESLAADHSIREVILSGGDPLTIADRPLAELIERIAAIEHVTRLRIHTRLPVMIPSRITAALLETLKSRPRSFVVIHANHPRELGDDVADAIGQLVDAGIPVLNQTVLLRRINDNAAALIGLSQRLLELRVLPYYLHQLDRVQGAAHFHVPREVGLQLLQEMRAELPGYAVPRYVEEIPGDVSKRVLG